MIVDLDGGETVDLGATEVTPTVSLYDFSRRETDDFGVTTIVKRGFSRRMSVRLAVPTENVDAVQQRLADLRATSALWVADERFQWLNVVGLYKDFDLTLPGDALSFCTLSVEGLAETETVADNGGDPAPNDRPSSLLQLRPIATTDSNLLSSSVPEDDAPAWASGTTYAKGAKVIRAHRVFESLVAGNVGKDPSADLSAWLDTGPTNRWAMFDQALGTVTTGASPLVVTLPAGQIDAVALLDVRGAQVRVQAQRAQEPHYDRTIPIAGGAVTFLDLLGIPSGNPITITVAGSGPIEVGTLLAGSVVTLGTTEAGPTAGIADFSKKEVDDFGEVTIVPRAWSKKASVRSLIRTDALDIVANRLAAVRAVPCLWIAEDGRDALTIYGFAKEWSIEVGQNTSKLALTIEGLSKATKIKPIGSVVVQGSADGTTWHVGLLEGDIFMRVSNDGGATYGAAIRISGEEGRPGEDGAYQQLIFQRAASQPATPTGGGIPAGWSDGVPAGTGLIWMSVQYQRNGIALGPWSTPAQIKGDDGASAITLVPHTASTIVNRNSVRNTNPGGWGVSAAHSKETFSRGAVAQWTVPATTTGNCMAGLAQNTDSTSNSFDSITFAAFRQADGATAAYINGTFQDLGPNVGAGEARFMVQYDYGTGEVGFFVNGSRFLVYPWGKQPDPLCFRAALASQDAAVTDITLQTFAATGANGDGALVAYLTNEAHNLPADPAGNVTSYTGASTSMVIMSGAFDVTSLFSHVYDDPGAQNPQGLSVTGTYPTFSVDGGFDAGEGAATFTFRAVGKSGTTFAGKQVAATFSLAKVPAGADGQPAFNITLSADKQFAHYDKANAYVGGAITFTAVRQNIPGPNTYFSLYRVSDGALLTADTPENLAAAYGPYWAGSGGDRLVMSAAAVADYIAAFGTFRVVAYRDGYAATDSVSIAKVKDGADGQSAYAVIMDNEAHVVPADAAGNVTSYAGAAFTFKVLYGGQDVTSSFGGNVGIAPGGNPQGLSVPGSWPSYFVNGGFDAGEDVAAVTLRFTGSGAHAGVVLDRTFSLTKSKAAVNGVSPPLIQVSATPQALRYDKDDQFAAGDVVFRASYQNTTGPVSWASAIGHGIYNTPGVTISGDTLTISAARMRDVIAYNVSIGQPASETIIASVSGVSDPVTVTKVRDGRNGDPGDPGAPGVSPIQVSAQPEALTINLDASGTPLPGALPVTIGNTAIQGAANVPIASVTIVSVTGVTAFAVGTAAINVTATAGGNDGEIVYDVVAAGQTIRKRVGVTITRSGADGAVQQNIGITSPQISWSSYQQHGGTLAINASGTGKLELNLTGNMRAALGGYLQFYSKLQYRMTGGTWTDVPGSERTSTVSEEQFEPRRQSPANVNGVGPYSLSGLTPSGAYEVRAMTAKINDAHNNSNTISMGISGKQVV